MEKKKTKKEVKNKTKPNTFLISIIIVGILIIIGVTTSYAYYSANLTVGSTDEGPDFNVTIGSLSDADLSLTSLKTIEVVDKRPGYQDVIGMQVTASNSKIITYNLVLNATSGLETDITYTVYKTNSSVNLSSTCSDVDDTTNNEYSESCTITNIGSLGTSVATGTITNSTTAYTLLSNETLINNSAYYYVVLSYPNLNESQDGDFFKRLSATLNVTVADKISAKSVSSIIAGATAGSTEVTGIVTTNEGIKYIEDGMYGGNTYYYRGTVNNNWVKFAGMYWRIIRINGDGSIRMIYSGTTAPTEATSVVMTGSGTAINNGATYYYATSDGKYNDASYVGFYWNNYNGHATESNGTKSYAAQIIDSWYSSNLSSYAEFIDQSGKFCNDRYLNGAYGSNYPNTYGTGTWSAVYAPGRRLYTSDRAAWRSPQIITTSCADNRDIFTRNVGLITGDEILMAGGYGATANTSYYLYTNQLYWSMSPLVFENFATLIDVSATGQLGAAPTQSQCGLRPVVNLLAGTLFTGSGTYDDVYKVLGTSD